MKKLLSLVAAMMITGSAMATDYVLGYDGKTAPTYEAGKTTFTVDGKEFTITNESGKTQSSSKLDLTSSGGEKYYGVKTAKNVTYTINMPAGISITKIKFGGWANTAGVTGYIKDIAGNEQTQGTKAGENYFGVKDGYYEYEYTLPTAQTGTITFSLPNASELILNITLSDGTVPTAINNVNAEVNTTANCKCIKNGRVVILKDGNQFYTAGQRVK